MKVATWQYTLSPRVRDAIAAYYARYPDATPGEIEAWLRDRGFDAGPTDVEEFMAALDSNPDWRTGWINRNIHRHSAAFDPDQFLATRGYGEDDGWQVVEDEPEKALQETEGEEYEDDEWEEAGEGEEDEHYGEAVTAATLAMARPLGGEDRLPGITLAVFGLAASAGVVILIVTVLR